MPSTDARVDQQVPATVGGGQPGRQPGDVVAETICTLDCPDACSLQVTIREGRIVDVDASPTNAFTDGWICSKVKRTAERIYSPKRIMTPLIRTGAKGSGTFRSASWDEALALITVRTRGAVEEMGSGDAVVAFTYSSSAASIERKSLSEAFFAAIGATQVPHTICAEIQGAAWTSVFGAMKSADPRDVINTKLAIIWGANPTVSNTHFPPMVNQAVATNGARVIVIDPRRTAMAKRADLHLAIKPGTDVVLAKAIAQYWNENGFIDHAFASTNADGVEEFLHAAGEWTIQRAAQVCGVSAEDIETMARWWGETKESMLRLGWGLERNFNGGAGIRAVLTLPVLGGKFGVPGSGVIGSVATGAIDATKRWPAFESKVRRSLGMHQIGQWLAPSAEDPCRVLFIQGANPAVMCPEHDAVIEALSREDIFAVVHEQVMTDTALYADVVLPATSSFEINDARASYGSYFLAPTTPIIAPVGESRSNDQVGLALALAYGFDWTDPGVTPAVADAGPRMVQVPSRQFDETVPFDGRAQLVDPVHGVPTYVSPPGMRVDDTHRDDTHRDDMYTDDMLTLISPASSKLVNSIFGEFQSPWPAITMHPDDASSRGVTDGGTVRVFNALGSIEVPVTVSTDTRPGVAVMSKGVWLDNHVDRRGVNVLTPAFGDPTVNGACFNDTFVRVEALAMVHSE